MTVGLDLDNTLVDYREVFEEIGSQLGLPRGARTKHAVREHLRARGREAEWTQLQAKVYGTGMARARLFPGASECLSAARRHGVRIVVISHRTAHAVADSSVDLHASAADWLGNQALEIEAFYFEETRAQKIARIDALACSHFVDDLPEVLCDPRFPSGATRWLFAPDGDQPAIQGCRVFSHWNDLREHLFAGS